MLHDFGTPKHPPMAAWLTYLTYLIFKSDFSIYLLSQSFIIAGFIYIYKFAKHFLDQKKAMLSVIVLEGCWCYSYVTGYYGFNPDVVLLFTLPAISYYFYNCMNTNKKLDWLKLGFLVGFSFLNKYQTAFLILPMFLWACIYNRAIFKNIMFYISILIAFVMFLPHLIWLFKYDFFPFLYFEGELTSPTWFSHLSAPFLFIIMQLAMISGTIAIVMILAKRFKLNFEFKLKNIKNETMLLLLCFTPNIIHILMGLYAGGTMRPRWGYEFWFLIGVVLFYYSKNRISSRAFKFTLKLAYIAMLIVALGLGGLLSIEKNYRSRYPVSTISNDLNYVWNKATNQPLKYVGGYIEWTLPLTIYSNNHPTNLLDTHEYKSPWINENDLKLSGALFIDRNYEGTLLYAFNACKYLKVEDFIKLKPQKYNFFVTNAFGQKREYSIYYLIIPPIK